MFHSDRLHLNHRSPSTPCQGHIAIAPFASGIRTANKPPPHPISACPARSFRPQAPDSPLAPPRTHLPRPASERPLPRSPSPRTQPQKIRLAQRDRTKPDRAPRQRKPRGVSPGNQSASRSETMEHSPDLASATRNTTTSIFQNAALLLQFASPSRPAPPLCASDCKRLAGCFTGSGPQPAILPIAARADTGSQGKARRPNSLNSRPGS
jgi:hypothetical protein